MTHPTVSRPFLGPPTGMIAVKVITHGDGVLKVITSVTG